MSTAILSASEISVKYGTQVLLDKASLAIQEKDRIGLLGRNGCGKSTFLRIAAGLLEPDAGTVSRRGGLMTGFLPQTFELDPKCTVFESIREGARAVIDYIEEYENPETDHDRSEYLLHQIEHFDGWNLDSRIKSLSTNLNTPPLDASVERLSGGEKRRVAFARALLAQPDFLILDEPTNHLDTETILWLETFLMRYNGGVLFVTHDRYFLDRVATRVVELSGGQFFSHSGNYQSYLEARAERQAVDEKTESKRQAFLRRELEWVRRGPRARTTKAKARLDQYQAVVEQEAPEKELEMDLIIPPAQQLSNRIIELKAVSKAHGGVTLFENLTLNLEAGQRIGIVGRNGLGKTTLLKVMLNSEPPDSGTVEHGPRTEINYIDQTRLLLNEENTVIREVSGDSEFVQLGAERLHVRAYLQRFLFTDDRIGMRVKELSGGEKSRALLAKILRNGGNVLVLDEPTNDLDIPTLRVLEEALAAFKGVVLLVSHDRYFLNRVCSGIIAFEGEGRVVYSVGNYDDYLARRAAKPSETPVAATAPRKKEPAGEAPKKLKWAERKELEGIETAIHEAEAMVKKLEHAMAAPDFYEKHKDDWKKLERDLEGAHEKVRGLFSRWEELEAIRVASEG